jgi:hypothetical protein
MKTKQEIEQLAEKNFPIEEYPTNEGFEHFAYKQGYTQCQNDMADKKYTEREVVIMLQDCAIHFGITNKSKDDGTFTTQIDKWVKNKLNNEVINSLNKQD